MVDTRDLKSRGRNTVPVQVRSPAIMLFLYYNYTMNDSIQKIMTLHPQGRKGVCILKRKYDCIKNFIVSTVRKYKEITYIRSQCFEIKQLSCSFDGSVS